MSLRELSRRTGLGTGCGRCVADARALLERERERSLDHEGAIFARLGEAAAA